MHTEPDNPAFTTTISGTHGETLMVTDDFERHGLLDGELLVSVLGPKGGCKYLFTISRQELARLSLTGTAEHRDRLGVLRNRAAPGSCGPWPASSGRCRCFQAHKTGARTTGHRIRAGISCGSRGIGC
jgi:hypothetical protein